ncbi:GNAT family N-acetyltransferase [Lewinella sp. IMCC34191]|uniref:GNAT family N-acetyltransferase n=1 Tax=Lewinella sp. IMCC34191 TaxID=2259172 RepID=UPI000E2685C1|nr:GNAT family N-acetyltransferase [Lewinella sp. IMCC34191]
MKTAIRAMQPADWPQVKEIYLLGMASGTVTFETGVPEWEAWNADHHPFCRIVAVWEGRVVGWLALKPISKRAAYRGVAEGSIYVHPDHRRRGIAAELIRRAVVEGEEAGIYSVQASVFPENAASIELLMHFGFRRIGVRKKVARRDGVWKDNVLLERRSELPEYN